MITNEDKIRAQSLIAAADRGEGRKDFKLLIDYLRSSATHLAELTALRAQLSACGDQIRDLNAEVERLRAELAKVSEWPERILRDRADAEASLAAANVLLNRVTGCVSDKLLAEINAHLAAQPTLATAPTRTKAEQRVLDAIESTLRRLGDDPPYYEVDPGDPIDALIAEAIMAWLGAAPPGGYR